jgi:hypothetical protein
LKLTNCAPILGLPRIGFLLWAEHDRQLGGGSPLSSLTVALDCSGKADRTVVSRLLLIGIVPRQLASQCSATLACFRPVFNNVFAALP